MTLNEILERAGVVPSELPGDVAITGITIDSRTVQPGNLFVCMPDMTRESETFIPDAANRGAVAAVVHSPAGFESAHSYGLSAVEFSPTGSAFADATWRICDAFFDHPTRNMKVIGVTGTNGKTTTAWLIRDMYKALGHKAAYLGTLGFHLPDSERELSNTTPFAVELYNLLAEARDAGVEAIAIEISSHALACKRADGLEFDAAVFTNLTQDHLDFHGTMDAYAAAKWRLFSEIPAQTEKEFTACFNLDDETGRTWSAQNSPADHAYNFGTKAYSDKQGLVLRASNVAVDGIDIEFAPGHLAYYSQGSEGFRKAHVKLGGHYNVENTAAAMAAVIALEKDWDAVNEAIQKVHPVPGRFEPVLNDSGVGVIVDYAHTPDALEKLLEAVRPLTKGRIITVFGCGGDRDKTKRPKMAKAASERSDVTIVTSDNPRTEDPKTIIRDILPGLVHGAQSQSIVDRREAVAHAIKIANPGDVVVIAGKGHENYQIIGRTKHDMDDRELARTALEARK